MPGSFLETEDTEWNRTLFCKLLTVPMKIQQLAYGECLDETVHKLPQHEWDQSLENCGEDMKRRGEGGNSRKRVVVREKEGED